MPLSVAPVDSAGDDPDVIELRLALVCYGGVSLAIYMHGITREVQSLVNASNAYERHRDTNPFDAATDTAHAYWEALKARHEQTGIRTRVVVDVIAGTSAGGINGVVLAKGLACDAPQTALRDVWLEQGDISVLLTSRWARHIPTLAGKAVGALLHMLDDSEEPPLNGNLLLEQVYKALGTMQPRNGGGGGGGGWPVELHVTMTDFHGYPLSAPAWNPKAVRDLRHRHHLTFRSDRGHFMPRNDRALAFAARATSSFPGAFPPVRIADIEDRLGGPWEGLADFLTQFWQPYTVAGRDARDSLFVDGGVLDNAPFDLAIAGIRARSATVQVDRRLLFIQPDPRDPTVPTDEAVPTVVQTVWGGLSTIPRAEPVFDQLLELRDLGLRVERADAVIDAVEHDDAVRLSRTPDADELDDENLDAHQAARDSLGPAAVAYRQLKLFSVLERLAAVACELANLPPASDQAFVVREVILAWGEARGLLAQAAEPTPEQIAFLRAFDLGYAERRLRFVIRRINALYGEGTVDRKALNALKKDLYGRIYDLNEVSAAAPAGDAVRELFSAEALADPIASPDDPDTVVARFVDERGAKLDALRETLAAYLTERLATFARDAYAALLSRTAGWAEEARDRLISDYVRFPVWDAVLFPIRAFGDAGELDRVEVLRVSPIDVDLLGVPGEAAKPPPVKDKLKGVAAGHFGAFFARDRRENDYLWGRLDGVERLVWLLDGDALSPSYRTGFGAVLGGEARDGALTEIDELREDLERQVEALPGQARSGAGRGAG